MTYGTKNFPVGPVQLLLLIKIIGIKIIFP
jgi:hypothetical protein